MGHDFTLETYTSVTAITCQFMFEMSISSGLFVTDGISIVLSLLISQTSELQRHCMQDALVLTKD